MIAGLAARRGNALPETALVMALLLLLIFGSVQMAVAGFDQLSADGSAFIGAHSAVAEDPTAPTVAYANQIASSIFPHTASNALTMQTPSPDTAEMDFSQSYRGIGFSKFLSSGLTTQSRIIEPDQGGNGSLGGMPLPYKSTACIESKLTASTGLVGKAPIGLPQIASLTSTDSGTGVIDVSATGIAAQLTARVTLFNQLKAAETNLITDLTVGSSGTNGLGKTVSALLSDPIVGSLLTALLSPTSSTLATIMNSAVTNALAGNTGALSTLGTTVSALVTSVNAIVAPLALLHPYLSTLVTNLNSSLSTVVTDLTTLAPLENSLNTLDSAASGVTCP